MGVKDLLKLSSVAMKYVIIEDTLLEAPRVKWLQGVKMSNLEYYIANFDPECWAQCKVMPKLIHHILLPQVVMWSLGVLEEP